MEKFSIMEVIEQATQTEKLGAHFYNRMADKFKDNQEIKKLFETLEDKELQHEETFSSMKEKVDDKDVEGWEEVSQYLRAIVESAFFLGKDKALTSIESVKTVSEAVDYALGFEKETLLYYQVMRDVIKEKKTIDEIINEEKSHIVWLNRFRQNIAR